MERAGTEVENIGPVTSLAWKTVADLGGMGLLLLMIPLLFALVYYIKQAKNTNFEPLDRAQVGGACCVYATLRVIRAYLRARGDDSPSLQDPINCCHSNGDIHGGWRCWDLLTFIKDNGLAREGDYPFVGEPGNCRRCKPLPNQTIKPRIQITEFKAERILEARKLRKLLGNGRHPVVACIFVGDEFGSEDKAPVLDDDGFFMNLYPKANKDEKIIGHAVMVIKSGKQNGRGFFLLENSYGPQWGDNGCVKIDHERIALIELVVYPIGVSSVVG